MGTFFSEAVVMTQKSSITNYMYKSNWGLVMSDEWWYSQSLIFSFSSLMITFAHFENLSGLLHGWFFSYLRPQPNVFKLLLIIQFPSNMSGCHHSSHPLLGYIWSQSLPNYPISLQGWAQVIWTCWPKILHTGDHWTSQSVQIVAPVLNFF